MSEENTSDEGAPDPIEGIGDPVELAMEGDGFLGTPWSRRTFLKAAALGTAAGAVFQKGPGFSFGPAAAYADDLSSLGCTANDVRIVGPGIIVNEPCGCTGTFDAQVTFHIINNTGTNRYCVTVHFCPVTLADGSTFAPGDVVFGNIAPSYDGPVTVTIPNYPCGQGLVCFGAAGSGTDGGFAKGENCPTTGPITCCSTITWNVKASDPCPDTTRQISSKCRHQQICIQGLGHATLDCDTSIVGLQTTCNVTCGSSTTLRLCTTAPASQGPFIFELKQGTTTVGGPVTQAGTCKDFTVGPITAGATYTGYVTDASGCQTSASVSLTTTGITPVIAVSQNDCTGVLKFTASASGFTGCTPAWTIDGVAAAAASTDVKLVRVNADGTLEVRWLNNRCHQVGVTLTCGSCSGSTTTNFSQCVATSTTCTYPVV